MPRPLATLIAILITLLLSPQSWAQAIKIVDWNCKSLITRAKVRPREKDLKEFGQEVKPDILLIQEITSLEILKQVRDHMGLKGYHLAISDFTEDGREYGSLEVGIISKFPFDYVVEYDPQPDRNGPSYLVAQETGDVKKSGDEKPLTLTRIRGIVNNGKDSRGFLYAKIRDKNLAVMTAHLKSARGKRGFDDKDNATQREFVAAAMVDFADTALKADSKLTVIIGGDFNVGEYDTGKNGQSLTSDRLDGRADGYDDTHALFYHGLVKGRKMLSLTRTLGKETYVGRPFFGVGPIDCFYVAGANQKKFTKAQILKPYGSDHVPVMTMYNPSAADQTLDDWPRPSLSGDLVLTKILPNPKGNDTVEVQQEAAWIKNVGPRPVNLAGWRLRDSVGKYWYLSGVVKPGEEQKILRGGQYMAMSNKKDTIVLLTPTRRFAGVIQYKDPAEDQIYHNTFDKE